MSDKIHSSQRERGKKGEYRQESTTRKRIQKDNDLKNVSTKINL